mmetsp:Transcript_10563/g.15840  ORF Transcript_10563/g.15840 Transcript_10563/m.15840 type:complete len:84 (+) Transcript_10563:74-325(+)
MSNKKQHYFLYCIHNFFTNKQTERRALHVLTIQQLAAIKPLHPVATASSSAAAETFSNDKHSLRAKPSKYRTAMQNQLQSRHH